MMTNDDTFCTGGAGRGEQLVAYLYDDLDAVERARIELHLGECAPCREELASLGGVRAELARWGPPEPARGLTAPAADRPPRTGLWATLSGVPAWAQAAAALLCVGVAAGLANLEVRYDSEGLVVRTGWSGPTRSAPVAAAPSERVATAAASGEPWQADLARLERELREALAARTAGASATVSAEDAAGLTRVQSLIVDSEQRQRRELALRLADVLRDVQYQRRDDLEKIDRSLGVIQANLGIMQNTGVEVMRQRQMINDLAVRVSQR